MSHVLEHFYPCESQFVLGECLRVLKPNGLIRIGVPDLEGLATQYIQNISDENYSTRFLEALYMKNKHEAIRHGHRWMYDRYILKILLNKVGFKEVVVQKFKEGRCPDIELLDNREELTLFVEAVK